jgi:hypothetical protein
MQAFIANVFNALYQPQTLNPNFEGNLIDSCRYKELGGALFDMFGYKNQALVRSTLFFALGAVKEPPKSTTRENCALDIVRSLFLMYESITRISSLDRPEKLEGLNALLDMPAVDMAQLVNDWLRNEVTPGNNRILLFKENALWMGVPSVSGVEWTELVKCGEAKTLREQFQWVYTALDKIKDIFFVAPELNSEGFPGPVVGWGGH